MRTTARNTRRRCEIMMRIPQSTAFDNGGMASIGGRGGGKGTPVCAKNRVSLFQFSFFRVYPAVVRRDFRYLLQSPPCQFEQKRPLSLLGRAGRDGPGDTAVQLSLECHPQTRRERTSTKRLEWLQWYRALKQERGGSYVVPVLFLPYMVLNDGNAREKNETKKNLFSAGKKNRQRHTHMGGKTPRWNVETPRKKEERIYMLLGVYFLK